MYPEPDEKKKKLIDTEELIRRDNESHEKLMRASNKMFERMLYNNLKINGPHIRMFIDFGNGKKYDLDVNGYDTEGYRNMKLCWNEYMEYMQKEDKKIKKLINPV